MKQIIAIIAAMWFSIFQTASVHAEEIDVELVIAMDVSASMDEGEFQLERDAMADAFESPEFLSTLNQLMIGKIAVSYIQWGQRREGDHASEWFLIEDEESARAFAAHLRETPRSSDDGRTDTIIALERAQKLLEESPYQGMRRVIDISGDGVFTYFTSSFLREDLEKVRRELIDDGVIINTLPIGNEREYGYLVSDWYTKYVMGGFGSFTEPAASSEDFARAFRRKLIIEIAGIPWSRS